jgi:hypothetical protein
VSSFTKQRPSGKIPASVDSTLVSYPVLVIMTGGRTETAWPSIPTSEVAGRFDVSKDPKFKARIPFLEAI